MYLLRFSSILLKGFKWWLLLSNKLNMNETIIPRITGNQLRWCQLDVFKDETKYSWQEKYITSFVL